MLPDQTCIGLREPFASPILRTRQLGSCGIAISCLQQRWHADRSQRCALTWSATERATLLGQFQKPDLQPGR